MNTLPEAFTETGVRLSLLFFGWAALFLVVGAVLFFIVAHWKDSETSFMIGSFAAFCGVILLVIWIVDLFPFDGKYQHYYEVSGTVEDVSNVLSDADGDLTRQPVVTLDSVDRPLVIDDPRAVTLKGNEVILRCTVDWNYKAADTYECKIVGY